ncbi:MAG: glycosyltransferase, partial [Eubacteriales bacterium]|nr:glycosyltransferase [Eubacteriales bacterium]
MRSFLTIHLSKWPTAIIKHLKSWGGIRELIRQYSKEKIGIHEKKIVLAVGQYIYRKGFDILLKASEMLDSDIGIYIIGGEPTKEYLQIIENYGLHNVHFAGFMNKKELSDYYKAADLFVLPTREDVWGLVINEALAYGLPIITT